MLHFVCITLQEKQMLNDKVVAMEMSAQEMVRYT